MAAWAIGIRHVRSMVCLSALIPTHASQRTQDPLPHQKLTAQSSRQLRLLVIASAMYASQQTGASCDGIVRSRQQTNDDPMYQRILVPVDGSDVSNAGLMEAIKLAKVTRGRIRLLHVISAAPTLITAEGFNSMSPDVFTTMKQIGQQVLETARAVVAEQDIAVDVVLLDGADGRLGKQVAEQAVGWNAEVIVLGSHGHRGITRMVLGSDAEMVIRSAPVPVLLVHANAN